MFTYDKVWDPGIWICGPDAITYRIYEDGRLVHSVSTNSPDMDKFLLESCGFAYKRAPEPEKAGPAG